MLFGCKHLRLFVTKSEESQASGGDSGSPAKGLLAIMAPKVKRIMTQPIVCAHRLLSHGAAVLDLATSHCLDTGCN